jgi:hypothetical protein
LGFKQCSFHHDARALRHPLLQRFRIAAALRACCFPFSLSALGEHVDPGTSFQVPPAFGGDMTVREMAHGAYLGTCKHS